MSLCRRSGPRGRREAEGSGLRVRLLRDPNDDNDDDDGDGDGDAAGPRWRRFHGTLSAEEICVRLARGLGQDPPHTHFGGVCPKNGGAGAHGKIPVGGGGRKSNFHTFFGQKIPFLGVFFVRKSDFWACFL